LRHHLQQLAANTGRTDERLFLDCPAGCRAIWSVFVHLGRTRPRGFGVGGIAYTEIEAWQRLTGVQLSPWELDVLTEIDARVLAQAGKKDRKT
jgi:hypothetical protein